jgi:hypothetical protein
MTKFNQFDVFNRKKGCLPDLNKNPRKSTRFLKISNSMEEQFGKLKWMTKDYSSRKNCHSFKFRRKPQKPIQNLNKKR